MRRPPNPSPPVISSETSSEAIFIPSKNRLWPRKVKRIRPADQDIPLETNDIENDIRPQTLAGTNHRKTDNLKTYNYNFPFNLQPNSTTTMISVSNQPRRDDELSVTRENSRPHHQLWVTGDMQYVTDFFDRWSFWSPMLPLKLLNATLRCFGTPLLLNNPISGMLIVAAIFLDQPSSLTWALGALVQGFIMCAVLLHPQRVVSSGESTQHAYLLGLLASTVVDSELHHIFPIAIFVAVLAAVRFAKSSHMSYQFH